MSISTSPRRRKKRLRYKNTPCTIFRCRAFAIQLFSGIFHNTDQDIPTLLKAENTGIQTDIVVLSLAPGAAGVVLIIDPAAFILFIQTGFR